MDQAEESMKEKTRHFWTYPGENKEKRMRRNEESLWELWHTIKETIYRLIVSPEGEEREDEGGRKFI